MSIETSKKKKGIQMPHTYIILFLIVLVVCLLTYVIPAGQFERQEDASGRMLIVPGTYTQVESSPVSPLEIPMAFVRTLGSSSVNEIIFFIFIIFFIRANRPSSSRGRPVGILSGFGRCKGRNFGHRGRICPGVLHFDALLW
mgnify:FL=1